MSTPAERGSAALASVLDGDGRPCEVWAEFERDSAAIAAARELRERLAMPAERTRVLSEDTLVEVDYERMLGPRPRRLRRLLVASHSVFGVGGALLGALLATLFQHSGRAVAVAAPGYPLLLPLLGVGFGSVAGLMLAGLWSLKPRRDFVSAWIIDALRRQGHAFVIVRARDGKEREHACRLLGDRALRLVP